MKTNWEIHATTRNWYVSIQKDLVVVGSNYGPGWTDNAGTCSLEDFLKGTYHDDILRDFDQQTLDEVIASVQEILKEKETNKAKPKKTTKKTSKISKISKK